MVSRPILAALLAASTLFMSGCLFSGSSKTVQSGTYVGHATFAQIEPGVTDQEFVLAVLGPPSSRATLHDGAELWKWEHTSRRSSSGSVLFLMASNSHRETRNVTFVLLRDGIVERAWQD